MNRQDLLLQITRAIVSVVGLGCVTALAWAGKVDSGTTTAIFTTVLSLYGAAVFRHAQTNGTRERGENKGQ